MKELALASVCAVAAYVGADTLLPKNTVTPTLTYSVSTHDSLLPFATPYIEATYSAEAKHTLVEHTAQDVFLPYDGSFVPSRIAQRTVFNDELQTASWQQLEHKRADLIEQIIAIEAKAADHIMEGRHAVGYEKFARSEELRSKVHTIRDKLNGTF